MKNLILCSRFPEIGELVKERICGKRIAFIPTASLGENNKDYVEARRRILRGFGAELTETEITQMEQGEIRDALESADGIYITGGNTFFLNDWLRRTGTDELLKKQIGEGKLYIGESAGAVVCAPDISYIEIMDPIPEDYSQKDHRALGAVDFYVLPHYLAASMEEITLRIEREFSSVSLVPVKNSQAVIVDGDSRKMIG